MDNSNEQFNTSSEARKEGVLRAKDIIPPLRPTSSPEAVSHEAGKNIPTPPAELETSPEKQIHPGSVPEARSEQIETPDERPLEPANTEHLRSEIPRFDLAEKIMAEQRRITAVRRKGPGQQDEAQKQVREVETVSDTKEQMSAELSEQEQIIVEIVARDVERLCRGDTLR
jgi:hypothetical protein